jgi:Mg2+ and Co2+ transporter CorA
MKNSTTFKMNKIFIYISKDIIITYEIELLSSPLDKDIENNDNTNDYKSKSSSYDSSIISIDKTFIDLNGDESIRFSDLSKTTTSNSIRKTISTPIISKILSLFQKENRETTFISEMITFDKIIKYGIGYFLYEILTESLALIDSIIEFLSYSVNCYQDKLARKNITGFRQLKDIYYVETSVMMVETMLSESKICINSILTEVGCGLDIKETENIREPSLSSKLNLNINLILNKKEKEILPFLISIADAYKYKLICSNILLGRATTTQNDLCTTTDIRTQQSQIILSVIATIFLPFNFFAGMYGMNFFDYDSQQYTLHILNEERGIYKFYVILVITAIICISVILYVGLIEIRIKWIQNIITKIKSIIKLNEC